MIRFVFYCVSFFLISECSQGWSSEFLEKTPERKPSEMTQISTCETLYDPVSPWYERKLEKDEASLLSEIKINVGPEVKYEFEWQVYEWEKKASTAYNVLKEGRRLDPKTPRWIQSIIKEQVDEKEAFHQPFGWLEASQSTETNFQLSLSQLNFLRDSRQEYVEVLKAFNVRRFKEFSDFIDKLQDELNDVKNTKLATKLAPFKEKLEAYQHFPDSVDVWRSFYQELLNVHNVGVYQALTSIRKGKGEFREHKDVSESRKLKEIQIISSKIKENADRWNKNRRALEEVSRHLEIIEYYLTYIPACEEIQRIIQNTSDYTDVAKKLFPSVFPN
jgi:hypothetical protein